ncbi:hypothetical protein [Ferroplasma sp.]|uniref:hypothetical protein n=1 Tax=Ferroplasma sp. TaxID=2591003 RepID=UPI00307FA6CF
MEAVHTLIKLSKKFKAKYLSLIRRLGKNRTIIAIARLLSETIYTMLKNNKEFIDVEFESLKLKSMENAFDNNYFERQEGLKERKLNNLKRVAESNGSTKNLIYRGGINKG